jgi:hypothetical protein
MPEEQLTLIEGVRNEPPQCFDAVVEAMHTVFSNQPEMEEWDMDRLSSDIWQFGNLPDDPDPEDVARAVRIYRERNKSN